MSDHTEQSAEEGRPKHEDEVAGHAHRRTESDEPAKEAGKERRPANRSHDLDEDIEGHGLNEIPAPGDEDDDEGRAMSDRALKHSIEPLGAALDAILSLAR